MNERSMHITVIEARDLSEAWFLCLRNALTEGYEYRIDQGSFEGQRRKELDLAVIQIRQPGIRPLVPDVPPNVPPPTTMEYVESYLPYLMTSCKAEGEQYTYGEDLEPQIPEIIQMYKTVGYNTNQAYMAVGSRESIYLGDPQCLRGIHTRIRYGGFHFVVYFRSWDLWGGFPSNNPKGRVPRACPWGNENSPVGRQAKLVIKKCHGLCPWVSTLAALQLMKEYMAAEIGVPDGEMICLSSGLHLYEHAWELAKVAAHMGQ